MPTGVMVTGDVSSVYRELTSRRPANCQQQKGHIMHSRTGIVAGLALTIIGLTAGPATADPVLPLPVVSIDLIPDRSTTSATEADTPTTAPSTAVPKPIKTASTTTREQAVTTHGGGTSGAARRQASATRGPAPSLAPIPRPATPAPPASPQAAVPSSNPGGHDHWFELAALVIFALLALSFGRRRRRLCAADLVAYAACRPEFADPAGVARRRLRSVE
jgi:hypothetical protein